MCVWDNDIKNYISGKVLEGRCMSNRKFSRDAFHPLELHWTRFVYIDGTTRMDDAGNFNFRILFFMCFGV